LDQAQFSQFLANIITPTEPYILYWHEASGTMQVGTWGTQITAANYLSRMLHFKFGSVVGMNLGSTAFSTANIKFNPTVGVTITGYGSARYNGEANMVPGYTVADWDANRKDVSASTYHNLSNIKVGKGDPCKLVGLTVEQVKAGAIDNKQYRLPTLDENQTFYGSSETNGATSIWTANGENAANPATIKLTGGTANGAVLPSTGVRFYTGAGQITNLGVMGAYWSSTAYYNPEVDEDAYWGGHVLSFRYADNDVRPSDAGSTGNGFAVRCVPQ
jgi:hypothetical protein